MRPLIVSLCWMVLMSCAAQERDTGGKKPGRAQLGCLRGSYIQLLDEHASWSKARWQALFARLDGLQVDTIVVQWSAFDQRPFYRAVPVPSAPEMPVESILRMADASGMRVMVGLSHDLAYWTRITKQDKRAYLAERLRINRQVATELRTIAADHPAFVGWYIPEEVDDLNWADSHDKLALFNYIGELSSHLRKLTPGAHVGVSGFVNRRTDPQALRDFWIELLARAPAINQIYFQDGIGVDKLRLSELPSYYAAMRDASMAAGRELVPVVEAFRQTAGAPLSKGDFRAEPTTLRRLNDQIAIANAYADRHVVFGVAEYMMPDGNQSDRLYKEYLSALQTERRRCTFTNNK